MNSDSVKNQKCFLIYRKTVHVTYKKYYISGYKSVLLFTIKESTIFYMHIFDDLWAFFCKILVTGVQKVRWYFLLVYLNDQLTTIVVCCPSSILLNILNDCRQRSCPYYRNYACVFILYFLGIGFVYKKYRKIFTYLIPCKHYCEKIKFYLSFYKIVGQEKHELENLMRQWTS